MLVYELLFVSSLQGQRCLSHLLIKIPKLIQGRASRKAGTELASKPENPWHINYVSLYIP